MQTVLSLVARGVADTVLPVSALKAWHWPQALQVAAIHAPAMRNTLALAVPLARPGTRLNREVGLMLRELVRRHFVAANV